MSCFTALAEEVEAGSFESAGNDFGLVKQSMMRGAARVPEGPMMLKIT